MYSDTKKYKKIGNSDFVWKNSSILFFFYIFDVLWIYYFNKIYIFLKKICNLTGNRYHNVVIERTRHHKIYFITYETSKWKHLNKLFEWWEIIHYKLSNIYSKKNAKLIFLRVENEKQKQHNSQQLSAKSIIAISTTVIDTTEEVVFELMQIEFTIIASN